jgi:O-antigen/teichoic acid export membrane protein
MYKAQIEFNWDNDFLKQHIKPALFLGLTDLLNQIRTKGDTLVLGWLSNSYTVGLYNRGYAFPHHASNFIQAVLQPLLIPKLADKSLEIGKKQFYISIFSAALLHISLFWIFKFVIHRFWLDSWEDLIYLLPIFILWGWASLLSGWHETILKSKQCNIYVFIRQSILALITILAILLYYSDFNFMISILSVSQALLIVIEGYIIYNHDFRLSFAELLATVLVCSGFLLYL